MVNVVSAGLCLTLAGWLVDRFGPKTIALASGLAGAGVIAILIVTKDIWGNDSLFTAWYVATTLIILLFYLAMLVLAMRVTDQAAAAINFNILMAGFAMGGTIAGASLGFIDAWGGLEALIGVAAAMLAVSASCAIFLTHALGPVAEIGRERGHEEVPVAALP